MYYSRGNVKLGLGIRHRSTHSVIKAGLVLESVDSEFAFAQLISTSVCPEECMSIREGAMSENTDRIL